YNHISEQELLRRYYQEGNKEWLGILLQRYTLLLLGVCMKYLKNEEAARDAVQQIFLKAITELEKYEVEFIKSWLYMIAKNHCLMQFRDKNRQLVELSEQMAETEDTDEKLSIKEKDQLLDWMHESIKNLNPEQQQCVTLFYLEKKSYQQVAEETEYLTDAFSREAIQFVKKNANQPFFLYLAYNAPHTPMQATDKYLQRFAHIKDPKRRTYAAMVSAMDDGINALLNTLEELKLDDNTLIFFLSDNGGPTNDNASNNKPLRGAKGGYYEGGIRVPFAVQWKGVLPAGKVYDMPVISLDIFATAAALTKQQPIKQIDGVNLIPYLTGANKTAPHKALYWKGPKKELYAIRTVEDKLIIQEGSTELFAIRQDKEEKNNLAASAATKLQALNQLLAAWKKGLVPPAFLGLLENEEYNKLHPDRFNFKN
ncbi:MAG: sigma-70 family RNA polymerase sigma factor, partial [Flavihumibacter sp.]|nr:sigma-70 family RNA polymerase sigma factor [Flavihumibacter sp.]